VAQGVVQVRQEKQRVTEGEGNPQMDSENHNTAFYTCTIIKNMAIISLIKYLHKNTVVHQVVLNKSSNNNN
jgi:hypothetical protein